MSFSGHTIAPRTLLALLALLALGAFAVASLVRPDAARAGSFKNCGSIGNATKQFKVKKLRITRDSGQCRVARDVATGWIKRNYDQNALGGGGHIWFCTWRRRAPKSLVTGTAECDAGTHDEIRFAVRHR
jgi:hypothetical protein